MMNKLRALLDAAQYKFLRKDSEVHDAAMRFVGLGPELLAVVAAAEGVRTSVDSADRQLCEWKLWGALTTLNAKLGAEE